MKIVVCLVTCGFLFGASPVYSAVEPDWEYDHSTSWEELIRLTPPGALTFLSDRDLALPFEFFEPKKLGCGVLLAYPLFKLAALKKFPMGTFGKNVRAVIEGTSFKPAPHWTTLSFLGPRLSYQVKLNNEDPVTEITVWIVPQREWSGPGRNNLNLIFEGPRKYFDADYSRDNRIVKVAWSTLQLSEMLEDSDDVATLIAFANLYLTATKRLLDSKEISRLRDLQLQIVSPQFVQRMLPQIRGTVWYSDLQRKIADKLKELGLPFQFDFYNAELQFTPQPKNPQEPESFTEKFPNLAVSDAGIDLKHLGNIFNRPRLANTFTMNLRVDASPRGTAFLKTLAKSKPLLFTEEERMNLEGNSFEPAAVGIVIAIMDNNDLTQVNILQNGHMLADFERPVILIGRAEPRDDEFIGTRPRQDVVVWKPKWVEITGAEHNSWVKSLTRTGDPRANAIVFEALRFLTSDDKGEETVDPFTPLSTPFRF